MNIPEPTKINEYIAAIKSGEVKRSITSSIRLKNLMIDYVKTAVKLLFEFLKLFHNNNEAAITTTLWKFVLMKLLDPITFYVELDREYRSLSLDEVYEIYDYLNEPDNTPVKVIID